MSASYIQVSVCPGGFDITSLLSLLLYTFSEWYDWRKVKRNANGNIFSSTAPMVLPFRILRYRTEDVLGKRYKKTLNQAHARIIRSIEDFVRAYANDTAIGRTYFLAHETLGYVILSTYMSPRLDMNCANNGLTFFDVARSGEGKAVGVYISGQRVDRSLRRYNVFSNQYRAWEKWMRNVNRIQSRETKSDTNRSFVLNYTERATLRVLEDNEKIMNEEERKQKNKQEERKYVEMRKIMSNGNRNGNVYVCSRVILIPLTHSQHGSLNFIHNPRTLYSKYTGMLCAVREEGVKRQQVFTLRVHLRASVNVCCF